MDVALALGGGGIRGIAHIGVLRVLEREGFKVRAIAGTSAGGMVGAIYSAGYSPGEVAQRLTLLDRKKLYSRAPGEGPSLLGLDGVKRELGYYLGDLSFRDLQIPFGCTAVDLEKGELVYLMEGPVIEAVQATIAIPGIFPPKMWNGRLVVDGGVLDPVPVRLARQLAPKLPVIAVALSPHPTGWTSKPYAASLLGSVPLGSRLAQLRLAQSLEIFFKSMDVAGCYLTDMRLQLDQPDVVIRPDARGYGLLDPFDSAQLIRLGEQAAEGVLGRLKRLNGWRRQLSQRLPWLSDFFIQQQTGMD